MKDSEPIRMQTLRSPSLAMRSSDDNRHKVTKFQSKKAYIHSSFDAERPIPSTSSFLWPTSDEPLIEPDIQHLHNQRKQSKMTFLLLNDRFRLAT